MRFALFFHAFVSICLLAVCAPGSLEARGDKSARLREEALATMENIVPHNSAAGILTRVTFRNNHAIWGRIFGDQEIAALVAVDTSVHRPDAEPEDATLFLLLWQDGWKYRQRVGPVSSAVSGEDLPQFQIQKWDWEVKRRLSPEASYVISRLELYPAGDYLSWVCDPKSHTLLPTGWRKDAIPSISGSSITFRHREIPTTYEIFRFTDHPEELIVSFDKDNTNGQLSARGFVVRNNQSGKMVSWWIWPKNPIDWRHPGMFGVSRRGPTDAGSSPPEDAIAAVDWGDLGGNRGGVDYFLWRLTGLGRNAVEGRWDQDAKTEAPLPRSVKVTGLPEAIEKFTWPPLEPGKK